MIRWAGISNTDVGMIIEHYPRVILPNRKIEVQTVPGRNGDIVIPSESFENYEQAYDAFLDVKKFGGLEAAMPKVSDWLLGHSGYQRLEDSYFPDVYRMAYYTGGAQFVSLFNEYGEGTLTFNCAPEKYLKYGERPITLTKNQKLINPTSFTAKPLITVTGNFTNNSPGVLTFTKDGVSADLSIKSLDNTNSVTIDTKLHKAYSGTANKNSSIVGKFENLTLGKETVITWNNRITSVSIIPRWWTI